MSQTPPTQAPVSTHRAVLNTIKGSAGNLVEWYDVYIYTVFAVYFENAFFDSADKNSTIYVYGIFAITFVMRPVGSWFFGRFADRHDVWRRLLERGVLVRETGPDGYLRVSAGTPQEMSGFYAALTEVLPDVELLKES